MAVLEAWIREVNFFGFDYVSSRFLVSNHNYSNQRPEEVQYESSLLSGREETKELLYSNHVSDLI